MPYLTKGIICNVSKEGKDQDEKTEEVKILQPNFPEVLSPGIHYPMSLDQFYYPSLRDSQQRDYDRAVGRWVEWRNSGARSRLKQNSFPQAKQQKKPPKDSGFGQKEILAVDQLWIRVLDDGMLRKPNFSTILACAY